MRKRLSIVLVIAVIFVAPLLANDINAQFGLDLRAGASTADMSNFNTNFSNLLNYSGINHTGSSITGAFLGGADIQYFPMTNLAAYLRLNYSSTSAEDVLEYSPTDPTLIVDSNATFSVLYAGIGAKYFFPIGNINLFPYAGLDIGMNLCTSSYWQISSPNDPASPITTNFNSSFGASIEIGAEYFFNDIIGVSLGGGYHLADLSAVINDQNKFLTESPFNLSDANLSGVYFLGGVALHFGATPAKAAAAAVSPYATYAQKYEQTGDYYFKLKNYKYALSYYTYAEKYAYAAKLPTAAATYRKVGYCYYMMGNKPYAIAVFRQYLVMNPSDLSFRNWLINYMNQK